MKVIVQNIEPSSTEAENSFDVFILLDQCKYRFQLQIEITPIGNKNLQMVTTDWAFDNLFKYNIDIHSRICKLVSAVYNHRPIKLPADIGELEIDRAKSRHIRSDQSSDLTRANNAGSLLGFKDSIERPATEEEKSLPS
jgi:hypothetical protein